MKEINYTILYCVFVRTFVIPFYYGSGTVINYGFGSDFLTSYGSGSTRQKVTVPTVSVPVSVPQHCGVDLPIRYFNFQKVSSFSFKELSQSI
jgi:hypothetical protein